MFEIEERSAYTGTTTPSHNLEVRGSAKNIKKESKWYRFLKRYAERSKEFTTFQVLFGKHGSGLYLIIIAILLLVIWFLKYNENI